MELALQFEDVFSYEAAEPLVSAHEEVMETAIPEYCPDIARIVDTVGHISIHERTLNAGKAAISGSVKVTILYTSEEADGLRSMGVSVPFSCVLENRALEKCTVLCTSGRVLLAEARATTSRKLYIKVLPEITATGYRPTKHRICTGAEEEQTLRRHSRALEVNTLAAITEKEFSFTENALLENGIVPEDVLLYRVCPAVLSVQRLGNKLMVKGELWLWVLYRDEVQRLRQYDVTMPFSQIFEALELPEAEYTLYPELRECDVRTLRTDTGCGFCLTARIGVYIKCYQHRTLPYIDDLYSVRFAADLKREEMTIPQMLPDREMQQEAQLRLELEGAAPFVAVTGLDCGPVEITAAENGTQLHTLLHVQLLYLDETGAPVSTERTAEVMAPAEGISGPVGVSCCRVLPQFTGSTCLVRIPVRFSLRCAGEETVNGITAATLSEREGTSGPSLVLYRMGAGETLWDIAKRYQTDEDAIRIANQLEDDTDAAQYMLLIPKLR